MRIIKMIGLALSDFCEAVLLSVLFILSLPIALLGGLGNVLKGVRCLWYLAPRGLLSGLIRARIDLVFKNHERAGILLNHVTSVLEREARANRVSPSFAKTLLDLYQLLIAAYFLGGHIDSASAVVIRAKETLGTVYLPLYPDFDARTAHIVKAGIAAGRLLEDGGLATLLVKQGDNPVVTGGRRKEQKPTRVQPRARSVMNQRLKNAGKVIPFPVREH
jgi:hypothetical protein